VDQCKPLLLGGGGGGFNEGGVSAAPMGYNAILEARRASGCVRPPRFKWEGVVAADDGSGRGAVNDVGGGSGGGGGGRGLHWSTFQLNLSRC